MQQKIILVTGATGAQGNSVARALLAEGKFAVRILTRNASAEKLNHLKDLGAQAVTGDMEDIESLKAAMKDCYGVFGVTDFFADHDTEYQMGKNLIDAVHQSSIKHFVFSSLEDYNKLSNGRFPVPHYDVKAALEAYAKSVQLPATFVQLSFCYEYLLSSFCLQEDDHGDLYFGFPQGETRLATISVEDYGGIVAAVFSHPVEYVGRTFRAVGSDNTCTAYAASLKKILGRKVYYKYIPRDEYADYNFPRAEELANMFEVQRLYIPNRQIDMIESYGLNPDMLTFESWVKKNKTKIEQAVKSEAVV